MFDKSSKFRPGRPKRQNKNITEALLLELSRKVSCANTALQPDNPIISKEETIVSIPEEGLTTITSDVTESTELQQSATKQRKKVEDDGDDIFSDIRDVLNPPASLELEGRQCFPLSFGYRAGTLNVLYLASSLLQAQYENKFERMLTFDRKFKSLTMTAIELAYAGFVSVDQRLPTKKCDDHVVCVWCGLTLWQFVSHVNAIAIHQTHSHHKCKFLLDIYEGK